MKAIVGDGSDNIPGVKGLGESTGIELLREFGSVEGIYKNIIKVTTKRKVQQKLIDNEKLVKRNIKLVSLNTSVNNWVEPQTVVTDETVDRFIDKFAKRTDSQELTNLLGVYLQRRKPR